MVLALPLVEPISEFERRRWDEDGILDWGAGCSNPVLGRSELTLGEVMPSDTVEELFVERAKEVEAEWAGLERFDGEAKRLSIVDDFMDVLALGLIFGRLSDVEEVDVAERRARALDA